MHTDTNYTQTHYALSLFWLALQHLVLGVVARSAEYPGGKETDTLCTTALYTQTHMCAFVCAVSAANCAFTL